jgi:hypothetical protein
MRRAAPVYTGAALLLVYWHYIYSKGRTVMVTVAQLIKQLSSLPQEHVVLLSSDEEGNSFHLFSGDITPGMYSKDDYYIEFNTEADKDELLDEYETTPFAENSVLLWP